MRAAIRMSEETWKATRDHLFGNPGEHFCFLLANWTFCGSKPVFLVRELFSVPDHDLVPKGMSMEMKREAIVRVINFAVQRGMCLIEAHNHGGSYPRFSETDRSEMPDFIRYVHSSLPNRPYSATVWGDHAVYGEYYLEDGEHGTVESVTVLGSRIWQIVSRDNVRDDSVRIFDRQVPWFTRIGQQQIATLRVAIVGCGGTGSHTIQQLAYLGVREFTLVDRDRIDVTNLNRVVTATPADIGTPKVILGRQMVRSLRPGARVLALETQVQSADAIDALKGVDVLFGCVDNDGARLILNELALAYSIPYFDLAVGIEATDGIVSEAGGRVAFVRPGGPCLYCMGQIDPIEALHFQSTPEEQAERMTMGYVSGLEVESPSVVSLNAAIASQAVSEFAMLLSGTRPVTLFIDYDLLGKARPTRGQWAGPVEVAAVSDCVQCAMSGVGDASGIERYSRALRRQEGDLGGTGSEHDLGVPAEICPSPL